MEALFNKKNQLVWYRDGDVLLTTDMKPTKIQFEGDLAFYGLRYVGQQEGDQFHYDPNNRARRPMLVRAIQAKKHLFAPVPKRRGNEAPEPKPYSGISRKFGIQRVI